MIRLVVSPLQILDPSIAAAPVWRLSAFPLSLRVFAALLLYFEIRYFLAVSLILLARYCGCLCLCHFSSSPLFDLVSRTFFSIRLWPVINSLQLLRAPLVFIAASAGFLIFSYLCACYVYSGFMYSMYSLAGFVIFSCSVCMLHVFWIYILDVQLTYVSTLILLSYYRPLCFSNCTRYLDVRYPHVLAMHVNSSKRRTRFVLRTNRASLSLGNTYLCIHA